LISKLFGLFREQAIAAAFGVGPVVNAYVYAYVIPGFLLILLGGINGPFHSSLVSVLSKREKSEAAPIVETVSTVVSLVLLGVGGLLMLYAGFCIDVLAPGLDETTRSLAVLQLRIMSPLAVLAGLIGIGFGTLNAADQYWLPSISPLFSSLAVLIGLGVLAWQLGGAMNSPEYIRLGGMVLAGGTLAGGVLQWGAQLWAQLRSQLGQFRLRFDLGNEGVKEVLRVMAPATLSSGMLHINVYTDFFFASYIAGAAAAMRYANFVVLTPLGIMSNMILVPFMPVFSRLAAPENWEELKTRIRQGILLTALTMLPLTAIFMSLANPIVEVIYQRYAFSENAAQLVTPVLMTYGFGMFFYLARDVLVRVFYALGDGETPFRVSLFNIFLNAGLDYVLVNTFKTPGLVMATIGVNLFSMVILLWVLNRRLNGLPLLEWGMILLALCGISTVSGFASFGVSQLWQSWLGTENLFWLLGDLIVCSGVAVGLFLGLAMMLQLPELNLLIGRLQKKFFKNS
ncbi:MAG: murein biosynthesis integral membrane protein MurJ, partial [Kamptonema sp. SIO4C4]|nr:murein biosynthesis integral membrane protein MurJ [Kamptonema sp. SIO4C4]